MSHWATVRQKARRHHHRLRSQIDGTVDASALVQKALRATGLRAVPVARDNPQLDGGEAKLDREHGCIWYCDEVPFERQLFYQAHELAHHWLGTGGYGCLEEEINPEASEEPPPLGEQRVTGYSPQERDEREANVFAREFLMPIPALRALHRDEGLTARAIAAKYGLEEAAVLHQMSRALLAPGSESAVDTGEPKDTDADARWLETSTSAGAASSPDHEATPENPLRLDESQRQAAFAEGGPLLLEAGPGTGKTRTLVGRIAYLLDQGTDPRSILALTFSNKAAAEMRGRVAAVRPEKARYLWMSTFHAYGLELLSRHSGRLGLPSRPKLTDPVDAAFLLEKSLRDLALEHYQFLPEPARHLKDIVQAISRAKDEAIGPEEYRKLAEEALTRASAEAEAEEDEKRTLRAQKALEVARVYAYYQKRLEEAGRLDFGDLIARSVHLLREHDGVRAEERGRFQHVLVDEYQDVNRASGLLLKELTGDGRSLWVVGDVRQSIYRWRGAAPENMRRFEGDFPEASRLKLRTNYRAKQEIAGVYSALAPKMQAAEGEAFEEWTLDRGEGGEVRVEVAEDQTAEGQGMARLIRHQEKKGVALRDQATLCRSHTNLARVAGLLEEEGVPVLYLGDVFERPVVRDMLSLLSVTCEPSGLGLLRVAEFPEYAVPQEDVLYLFGEAREREMYFPEALGLASELDLTAAGQKGIERLRRHIEGVSYATRAWSFLAHYLFSKSRYLDGMDQPSEADGARTDRQREAKKRQRRLALFQFLQFAHGHKGRVVPEEENPRRALLAYVRRLAKSGEDRALRDLPEWAESIDAVRLMTIHASKGLEFDAVYLPVMSTSSLPARRQWNPCPPPEGMVEQDPKEQHREEEECLFFVGLSRARDFLCLSRAERYGSQNRNPSKFFKLIEQALPTSPECEPTWKQEPRGDAEHGDKETNHSSVGKRTYSVYALDDYIICPRKYFYKHVLNLGGWPERPEFLRYHSAARQTLLWIVEQRADGKQIDEKQALECLGEIWDEKGPVGHPYEALYREKADAMVRRAVGEIEPELDMEPKPELKAEIEEGVVIIYPDMIARRGDGKGVLIRHIKTGKPRKREADKNRYALYHQQAEKKYPDYDLQAVHPSTGEIVPLPMTKRKRETRVERYNEAIRGVESERFEPSPDSQECPKCPFYHVCPAGR